jgi:ketosteroid isomerase-like protein
MSQENVEIMKAAFAAWNAGDMEAFRELHDPHVVVRTVEGWPEPGPYFGREAVMRWFEQLRETWDSDTVEMVGISDVGDRVVVRLVLHGEGRGPQAHLEMTQVITLRKGKIVYREYFWDHAEALEAVGLSELDARADS